MSSCHTTKYFSHAVDHEQLVAWCIVPYDAQKRNPTERARMLRELGIGKLAYDWRDEHIPQFDDEWAALKHDDIQMQAFWMIADGNPDRDSRVHAIFDFLERNHVHTQIWLMLDNIPELNDDRVSQEDKINSAAEPIRYIAERAKKLGCQVALYNHGNWYGEPENQLALIEKLGLAHVGMVYNFHHAKEQALRFREFFPLIKPHLLSLNLAGLKQHDLQHFYALGAGDMEKDMITFALKNGYSGPFGIIGHDETKDVKDVLRTQIKGLKEILLEMHREH